MAPLRRREPKVTAIHTPAKTIRLPAEPPCAAEADETGATALVTLIRASLDDDKAEDLVVIDLLGKTTIADAMVVASGRSARQVSAMAEHLAERLKSTRHTPVAVEGLAQGDWVLIDAGDVIVHLFRPEVRAFYRVEEMWGADTPLARVDLRGLAAPV